MKFKYTMAACAAALLLASGTANAAEDRLSRYEVGTFVTKWANAINNPNSRVGRSFLEDHLAANASFEQNVRAAWANPAYLHTVDDQWAHPYYAYRYPYSYDPYYNVVSQADLDKDDLITQLENKKGLIPRYHQEVAIMGTRMTHDASSAIVDIRLNEYGYAYTASAYYPYYHDSHKMQHSESRCLMYLEKDNDYITVTGMDCNTSLFRPL